MPLEYVVLKCHLSSFFSLVFIALFLIQPSHAEEVDLELVLAMDASGSISEREYRLQLQGTSNAFRDLEIIEAIKAGPTGKIAVALMLWSDASNPKEKSDWFILSNDENIRQFANFIESFQVNEDNTLEMGGGGGTGIGSGVQEALAMIASNGIQGLRKVVDVSGDGIETEFSFSKGVMIRDAKLLATLQNVTINGLPILSPGYPNLDQYYRDEVISGAGAFIVTAKDFNDFGRAIRKKLLREIRSNLALNMVPKNKRLASQD